MLKLGLCVLKQVLGNAAAPRYRLQRIIGTREAYHKAGSPPNTLEDLEQYADGTVAQVQALQVRCQADTLCSALGLDFTAQSVLATTSQLLR